jgi:hypothetical protein
MVGKGHIPSPAELLTFVVFIYILYIYIIYRKKSNMCLYGTKPTRTKI